MQGFQIPKGDSVSYSATKVLESDSAGPYRDPGRPFDVDTDAKVCGSRQRFKIMKADNDNFWVLREDFQSERQGKEIYFRCMTEIGPSTTDSIDEAEKFDTKLDALQCLAIRHTLSFFKPHEI